MGKLSQKTLESDGAPNIKVYELNEDAHFFAHYVVNDESETKYKVVCEYSECIGVTLLEPFEG